MHALICLRQKWNGCLRQVTPKYKFISIVLWFKTPDKMAAKDRWPLYEGDHISRLTVLIRCTRYCWWSELIKIGSVVFISMVCFRLQQNLFMTAVLYLMIYEEERYGQCYYNRYIFNTCLDLLTCYSSDRRILTAEEKFGGDECWYQSWIWSA